MGSLYAVVGPRGSVDKIRGPKGRQGLKGPQGLRPVSRWLCALLGAGDAAGGGHAFAKAAGIDEVSFETADLSIEQIGRHLDQADDDVGADLRVGVFNAFAEGLVGPVAVAVESAQALCVGVACVPFLELADSQEIALVRQQFLQAGASDVGQLDLDFLGGPRRLAAFDDILLTRAGGLDHLIARVRSHLATKRLQN